MKIYHFILILLSILITSCNPYYYLPTKQNVMVFEKKGDIIVSGNLGLGHEQMGIEAGYSFTDNIGVYSSFYGFNISNYGNSSHLIKDFIWDNELIIYKKFDYGLYTGVNFGLGLGKINSGNPYYDLGLSRQFIQPSLGLTISHFDFAFSTRITRLGYTLKSTMSNMTDYDNEMFQNYFDFKGIDKEYHYFVEPAFTFGLNYEVFKLYFQYTKAFKSGKEADFYIPDNLTTTVSFNIEKIFFDRLNKTKKLKWTF